jgi:tetratricopeptide (TPR) repeat protein
MAPATLQDGILGPARLGHLALALHQLGDYDRELEVAVQSQERFPDRVFYAGISSIPPLAALGHVEEVFQTVERCLVVPPRDTSEPRVVFAAAIGELRWHGYPEAAAELASRAVDYYFNRQAEDDTTGTHRWDLAACLYMAERWDEAQRLYEQLLAENPRSSGCQSRLGCLAARRGGREEALRILAELQSRESFGSCARIAALLGERERALDLIQEAWRQGAWYTFPHAEMDFESLRDFPPFQELMRPKG